MASSCCYCWSFLGAARTQNKQSDQQVSDKAKPVMDKAKGSPKVVEMPQGKEPLTGKTVKEEGKTSKSPTAIDKDLLVFPPE